MTVAIRAHGDTGASTLPAEPSTISRNPVRQAPTIGIIGAGLGGIALAVKLKQAGIDSFTIYEKSAGPGGTWWDNRYPGAACDVSALLYSYSFMSYEWSGTHPAWNEIQAYVEAVIDRFGLRPHIVFNTAVAEARWREEGADYLVTLEGGKTAAFDVVVSAVGMLNVPNYPNWPGLENFAGPKFHTARWESQHDLRGKRVAVVGTGSTTAQLVPAIAPDVGHLAVYQREAGWISPKDERIFSSEERAAFRRSGMRRKLERLKLFWGFESLRSSSDPTSSAQKRLRNACEKHIAGAIMDPVLKDLVTPKHDVFCKRPILSNTYLPALARDNVELIPHSVASVTRTGIVDAMGKERAADVLIMATGFKAAEYLATIEVRGRNGISLHAKWNGEPSAYMGMCVPDFPNFYMLYGPGTNGGSIIYKLERQAEWILRVVKKMRRRGLATVEVKTDVYVHYNQWLDRKNSRMAWSGGCNNYFTSASGRIVTQWPGSMAQYTIMTLLRGFRGLRWERRRSQPAPNNPKETVHEAA